jgi:hypothetical protein
MGAAAALVPLPNQFSLKCRDEREALVLRALSLRSLADPTKPVAHLAPLASKATVRFMIALEPRGPRGPRGRSEVGREIRPVRAPAQRAAITRGLAAAVAFGDMHGVVLHVHPDLILFAAHGVVCEVDEAPDARFCPPCASPKPGPAAAWAIGCVLHMLITGRAPVSSRDAERGTHGRAIVRCLGTPTISESRALGIPVMTNQRPRARVRGSTETERLILRSTLAWDPSARMICTTRGLVSSLRTHHEEEGG